MLIIPFNCFWPLKSWVGGGGGWAGQFDLHPLQFFQKLSCRERVKPWNFVTFNITISHIFPKNFIEVPRVVLGKWKLSLSILTIFINFPNFLYFLVTKKLMTSESNRWFRHFYFQPALNSLLNNCVKLNWY